MTDNQKRGLILMTCHILGSVLIGMEFGWKIGVATALLTYVVMPYHE